MKGIGLALTVLLALAPPAAAAEVIVKASGVSLQRPFVCGDRTNPAGRYTVEALHEAQPNERTLLRVYEGDKTLCEVPGSPSQADSTAKISRTHVLTKVNTKMRSIEIDVIL